MRVVKEFIRPECKVTIFSWNGKYLIKLEKGLIEQTFKIPEMDITSEDDLEAVLNDEFMKKAEARFQEMMEALRKAMQDVI